MKISLFTTLGNIGNTPDYWQYAWREAVGSYLDFADEVVVVWGGVPFNAMPLDFADIFDTSKIKVVQSSWPYDFSWEEIAKHFNAGLDACTGDWIIKMDIDYILHEKEMELFKQGLMLAEANKFDLVSYMKTTVLNKDKFYQKLAVPFCIGGDKKYKYRFGIPNDNPKSAWGYPIIVEGFDEERGLPTGRDLPGDINQIAFRSAVKVYNYDNTFRNKEITKEHFLRFSNARAKAGFKRAWGSTREEAIKMFCKMFQGRLRKTEKFALEFKKNNGHPKYIKDRINNLTPDLFGFNNWDNFKGIL